MKRTSDIVITGIGVLSPLGTGVETFWNELIKGACGIRRVGQFSVDSEMFICKVAAEIPDFEPAAEEDEHELHLPGRSPLLTLKSLSMALQDAGIVQRSKELENVILCLGSAQQNTDTLEKLVEPWVRGELSILPGDAFSRIDPYASTMAIADICGIKGVIVGITTSCTSGVLALTFCMERLRLGEFEMGLVVGSDIISPIPFLGEGLTGELTKHNDDPAHASRPFDSNQDGYVIGEGAVALVVETELHALQRGCHIYARVGPYAATTDATSFKYIDESGTQMARGMSMVLNEVPAERIDYLSAHAPSIVSLDIAESAAIRKAFGKKADRVPVTSIKGAIGNPSAAGGLLQLVAAILSIRDSVVPPTLNLLNRLPGCDLDYVSNYARHQDVNTVLLSAHGGGGLNASLIVRGYP